MIRFVVGDPAIFSPLHWKNGKKHFATKILLAIMVNLWVGIPYFSLQQFPIFPVTQIPETMVDKWIPFTPQHIWIYQTLYLYTGIGLFFQGLKNSMIHYISGIAVISLLANGCFFAFPTMVPRPDPGSAGQAYLQFIEWEAPLNAFPSLHVALAVYAALYLNQRLHLPVISKFALTVLWPLLIIYTTLSTKQHYIVDVIGGSILAWLVFRIICKEVFIQKLKAIFPE